ncbi:hypothetical protein GFS31_15680 [Leptolyngbya sp. BL0902]|uniref:serine hydrolase n=1 Tax=Leptolyngbya sp. BL0902 TaxID=1115757 RepID=UPI0018E8459D|nr:serine hydrolase [Leptolyngbya sp. BL0902]QQE64885.1 hypothetical protein GFS31_15680 [Leptolyngbya sp. BL0902]
MGQWVYPSLAVGLALTQVAWVALPAFGPGLEVGLSATTAAAPQSLADLYTLRDHLQALLQPPDLGARVDLSRPWPSPPEVAGAQIGAVGEGGQEEVEPGAMAAGDESESRGQVPAVADSTTPADRLWALHHRIYHEELAQRLWQQAARQAAQAYALGDPTTLPDPLVPVAYQQWQAALYTLSQVPPSSFAAPTAAAHAPRYRQQLATVAYRYDTLRSAFLYPIAAQGGDAERVRITACNLQRECRRWQGNRPPVNPASLIKVPVAVALIDKLHREGVDRQAGLWVNPSNWTEDAGWIRVRSEYAVEQVVADMISRSGNVATNQLIDYLGWDGVNQPLRSQGYTATRITTKLVGEKTYPANRGFAPNQITTDELTDMMVGIYNHEYPGSDILQAALAQQVDIRLGKTALRPPMIWLGEKTGRNSQVIGSTTAVLIGGQPYIITATLDRSGNEAALRSVIAGVAEHILTHDGFDPMGPASLVPGVPPSRAFLP